MNNIDERYIIKVLMDEDYNTDQEYMKIVDKLNSSDIIIQDRFLADFLKAREDCLIVGDMSYPALAKQYDKNGGNFGYLVSYADGASQDYTYIFKSCLKKSVEKVIAKSHASRYREALKDYEVGRISHEEYASIVTLDYQSDDDDVMTFGEASERFNKEGPRERVKTGFRGIDRTSGGLARGRVTILAARPGVGKSDLALNIAININNSGKKVLICSAEMDYYEIVERMQRTLTYIVGSIDDIIMDVAPIQTVARVVATANRYKPDMVIVDHLQALIPTDYREGLYERTTNMSAQFRVAAKGHVSETYKAAAWLVLCQLSRQARTEHDQPVLADLRDSGALEQDADAVHFLHEPDSREPEQESRKVQITIAKNRGGYCGYTTLRFHMSKSYWEE